MKGYFGKVREEIAHVSAALAAFERTLGELRDPFQVFTDSVASLEKIAEEKKQPLSDALVELADALTAYQADRESLVGELEAFGKTAAGTLPRTNADQHAARQSFDPLADRNKSLIKQVDLLYKLAARAGQLAQDLAGEDAAAEFHDRRVASRHIKLLDAERKTAVEQLKLAVYFHRQIVWLQDRFPDAKFEAVPGLCNAVTRAEIEAADWSLTPGRYVGVAPPEEDEDFDFEKTLRDIHVELADLNREAAELAARIQENFEELGV